jgi:hypothetical protein
MFLAITVLLGVDEGKTRRKNQAVKAYPASV